MSWSRRRHRAGRPAAGVWALLLAVGLLLVAWTGTAAANSVPDDGKYRLGLLEVSPHWTHRHLMHAYREALADHGLGKNVKLVPNAVFTPPEVGNDVHALHAARELMARDDLDLILALGKKAALALLKTNNGKTPVLVMAVNQAGASDLLTTGGRSAARNFLIRRQPDRWLNMFRYFQVVVPFRRMGVICPAKGDERDQEYLDQVREIAREQGFDLIQETCAVQSTAECLRALIELKKKGMDAFYITDIDSADTSKIDPVVLLDYLNKNHVATLSTSGKNLVKRGALIGFEALDFVPAGRFLAAMTASVLSGESLERVPKLDLDRPHVSINFETARALGLNLPPDALISADTIYTKTDRSPVVQKKPAEKKKDKKGD